MQQGRKRCCLKWAVAVAVLLMCVPVSPAFAHPINEATSDSLIAPSGSKSPMRANTNDTKYNFVFTLWDKTEGTPGRRKEDTTPTYVNIATLNIGNGKANMYVDGGKSQTGSWKNMTVGGYAPVQGTGKWRIHNNVKEKGYSFARLTSWLKEGTGGRISGWWSPDSMYSYPSMN